MVTFDFNNPLKPIEGEPEKAYRHLILYHSLGSQRSLDLLSKHPECEVQLRQLQNYSADWLWQDRIKYQFALDFEVVQTELKELRVDLLKRFGSVLALAMDNISVEDTNISQLSTAFRTFVDGYASIFDALPTRKIQTLSLNSLSFEDVLKQLEMVEK